MKLRRFIVFLFAASSASLLAEPLTMPSLTIGKGNRAEVLELRELSITTELKGFVAETVFELAFYNHTKRRQEGEFLMALPQGATVSSYALEVNGKMRVGVAVEKEQAKNAYESIKRMQIDPGIVEREAGNIYRTRIFPIERENLKRVRIGFLHELPKNGISELFLQHDKPIGSFSYSIKGAASVEGIPEKSLKPADESTPENRKWIGENVVINGLIKAKSKIPTSSEEPLIEIFRQEDGSSHLLVQGVHGRHPVDPEVIRKEWKELELFWDCSYSGRLRNHDAEKVALKELLTWAGEVNVTVHFLNTSLSTPETFLVQKGNTTKLESYLDTAIYNGSADFSLIPHGGNRRVLVSDGQISSPIWIPENGVKFHLLTHSSAAIAPELINAITVIHNYSDKNWLKSIQERKGPFQVEGLSRVQWDMSENERAFLFSAKLKRVNKGKVTIRVPGGFTTTVEPEQIRKAPIDRWNLVRRFWAQRRLAELERKHDGDEIRSHAIRERLVSDETSVIVLERFEDHLTYRITPPEPHLLEQYNSKVTNTDELHFSAARKLWINKLEWHKTEFAWLDEAIVNETAAVAVWVKASRTAFPEAKRNEAALKRFESWEKNAKAIILQKNEIANQESFEAWTKELEKQTTSIKKIREQSADDEQRIIHTSVRGFVRDRGIYSLEKPFFLRDAIAKAGAPNHFGSLKRVYLYRDAQRTGYNLESPNHESVSLRNGDMIVVEHKPPPMFLSGSPFSAPFADPFSAPVAVPFFEAPRASGGGPAIFEPAGSAAPPLPTNTRPASDFFGQDNDSDEITGMIPGRFTAPVRALPTGLDEALLASIKKSETPVERFNEGLSAAPPRGISAATFIEVARYLFETKNDKGAFQALSNLGEMGLDSHEATRSIAYWLHDFGRNDEAVKLLRHLLSVTHDAERRALISFDIGRLSESPEPFLVTFKEELKQSPTPLLPIALTDYFARDGVKDDLLFEFKRTGLPSQLRIVATMSGASSDVEIEVPCPGYSPSRNGGLTLRHPRVVEFQMKRAFPGQYPITLLHWEGEQLPLTIHLQYYLHWGGSNQILHSETILLDQRRKGLEGVEFGWEN